MMPKYAWQLVEVENGGFELPAGCPPIGPKPQLILPSVQPEPPPRRFENIAVQSLAPTPPPGPQIARATTSVVQRQSAQQGDNTRRIGEAIYHPLIGGKMTIFVLMYGDYFELHQRCLNSILSTTPPGQREIRIGCNAVCHETLAYLSRLREQNHIQLVYSSPRNEKKYPMMRRMFWDSAHPINTKWILWFDDDSICNKDPEWYSKLATAIVQLSPEGFKMFGRDLFWNYSGSQLAWVKSRPWYKGRQFQVSSGKEAPNGHGVRFVAGGFWALEVEALRKANIPDTELGHNGGDVCIGSQLWQAGFRSKGWNNARQFISESSVPRRGITEAHPGQVGWKPGG